MFARLVSHTFFQERALTLLGPELGVVKLICLLDRIVKLLIEMHGFCKTLCLVDYCKTLPSILRKHPNTTMNERSSSAEKAHS